jgi:hypothetical protein
MVPRLPAVVRVALAAIALMVSGPLPAGAVSNASIASFLTTLHGRVVVLVAPSCTRLAARVLGVFAKMDAAHVRPDVERYVGRIPDGYDYAIVFAPPDALRGLRLPVRPRALAFVVVNPSDGVEAVRALDADSFGLLQVGDVRGTPLLAVSYHGAASASATALEHVTAAQLGTQIADVSIVNGNGVTTYDVGEKLRVRYPGDLTPGRIWLRIRLRVVLGLLALIVAGGWFATRRLTGRTVL